MNFLKLSVTDADGNTLEYDFENNTGTLDGEDVVPGIESVLFGNDALFSGANVLTIEHEGKEYAVKRDFSLGLSVRCDGKTLPQEDAEKTVADIAAISDKQWRINASFVNVEEFIAEPDNYTIKFLSSLGYDSEELENIGKEKERLRTIKAAQADALKELAVKPDSEAEAKACAEMENAEKELERVIALKTDYSVNAVRLKRIEKLQSEQSKLLEKETDFAQIEQLLAADEELKKKISAHDNKIKTDKEQNAAIAADIDALSAEIELDEKEVARLSADLEKKNAELANFEKRIQNLSDEFIQLLDDRADDGELTTAALDRAADGDIDRLEEEFAAFDELDESFRDLSKKLADCRIGYAKRSVLRDGMALETAITEKRNRLDTLKKLLESQKEYLADLEKELTDSKAMYESDDRDKLARADEKRMRLFRYKILCHTLQVDISAAQQKIRANEEAKQSYAEDIKALTRAKNAINDYVEKCEARNAKLSDKLISLKARLSFCKDVDELEYGALCPICNGRITDKIELSKENSRLTLSYNKYNEELVANRTILTDYSTKLEKIDTRLGQLHERDNLCNSYLESLNVSVSAKQTALTGILKEAGANSVPTLEKMCDAADKEFSRISDGDADGAFLKEHIEYLEKEAEKLTETVELLGDEAESLESELDETVATYETEIAVGLDGRSAFELVDEVSESEKNEEVIFEELIEIEQKRARHLEFILKTEQSAAPEYVRATVEILSEIVEEIRNLEKSKKSALAEKEEAYAAFASSKAMLDKKLALLQELNDKAKHDETDVTKASDSEQPEENGVEKDAVGESDVDEKIGEEDAVDENVDEAKDDGEDIVEENDRVKKVGDGDIIEEKNVDGDSLKARPLSDEERAVLTKEISEYRQRKTLLAAEIETLTDEIRDIDFDEKLLDEAKENLKAASNALVAVKERNALHDDAENIARKKLIECTELAEHSHILKKLADGEISEVIMPVINNALQLSGSSVVVECDGKGFVFTEESKKEEREMSPEDLDADTLAIATACALNHVLKIASGKNTVKFVRVEKPQETHVAAERYGIVLI